MSLIDEMTRSVATTEDWQRSGLSQGQILKVASARGFDNWGIVEEVSVARDCLIVRAFSTEPCWLQIKEDHAGRKNSPGMSKEEYARETYPVGARVSDFSDFHPVLDGVWDEGLQEGVVIKRAMDKVVIAPLTDFTYYRCKLSDIGKTWRT